MLEAEEFIEPLRKVVVSFKTAWPADPFCSSITSIASTEKPVIASQSNPWITGAPTKPVLKSIERNTFLATELSFAIFHPSSCI